MTDPFTALLWARIIAEGIWVAFLIGVATALLQLPARPLARWLRARRARNRRTWL